MGKKTSLSSILNGVFVGSCLFFSTFFGCVVTQFPWFVLVRPFSRRGWRYCNRVASDTWYRFVIFMMENWNGIRLRVSGDELREGERVLLISNHPSEADWFFAWSLSWRYNMCGNMKIAIKKEFQYLPGLGWSIDNLDYVLLSRKWEHDEAQIAHSISTFIEDQYKLWFLIFPEGTDFTKSKQVKSWEFADKNGMAKYKHLLCPRTKGFTLAASKLHPAVDAVYDITMQYPGSETPSFWSAVNGTCPRVVNMHIKRHPISTVPKAEEGLKQWCFDRWKEKDELMEYFEQHGYFPGAEKKDFLGPGKGLVTPPIAFFLWGFGVIVLSVVAIYMSTTMAIIYTIAWAIFASFAHSKRMRRWRGLDPPRRMIAKDKKAD